jgi:anti-sigma B factor antagonist
MEISIRKEDKATVVVVTGEVDGRTAPQAQEQILPVVQTASSIVLDMAGVTFMSSAGLRMLLLLYRQATAKNVKVVLAGLSAEIKDTMSMTGFLDYFEVADSVAEGLQKLA